MTNVLLSRAYATMRHLQPNCGPRYGSVCLICQLLCDIRRHLNGNEPMIEPLTKREREVLGLLGLQNKEIAHALGISERTIRTHVSNILGKLDCGTRTEAALYAVKHGLLEEKNG